MTTDNVNTTDIDNFTENSTSDIDLASIVKFVGDIDLASDIHFPYYTNLIIRALKSIIKKIENNREIVGEAMFTGMVVGVVIGAVWGAMVGSFWRMTSQAMLGGAIIGAAAGLLCGFVFGVVVVS